MSTEPMNVSEPPAVAPHAPAASEAPQAEPNPTEKLRKRIVFGFTGTVVIGFALAGWYVGGRISANDKPRPAVAANAPLFRPAAATTPAAKPAASATPAVESHAVKPVPAASPAVKSVSSPAAVLEAQAVKPAPPAAPASKPVVSPAPVLEAHAAKPTLAAAPSANPVAKAAPARPASPAPAVAAAKPAPAAPALPETAKVHPASQAASSWSVVEPRPREKYLQIAALGRRTTTAYLQVLQAKGFRPVVGPGPSDGIYRILVGPFADKAALEQTQNTLHAAGLEPFVRAY